MMMMMIRAVRCDPWCPLKIETRANEQIVRESPARMFVYVFVYYVYYVFTSASSLILFGFSSSILLAFYDHFINIIRSNSLFFYSYVMYNETFHLLFSSSAYRIFPFLSFKREIQSR